MCELSREVKFRDHSGIFDGQKRTCGRNGGTLKPWDSWGSLITRGRKGQGDHRAGEGLGEGERLAERGWKRVDRLDHQERNKNPAPPEQGSKRKIGTISLMKFERPPILKKATGNKGMETGSLEGKKGGTRITEPALKSVHHRGGGMSFH